jgi:glutamate carboxypeptidase
MKSLSQMTSQMTGLMIAAATLAAPAAAALTAPERAMIATVEAEKERSIALLEKLVNINSGTMNPVGVEKVYQAVKPELEQLGFTVRWVPMTEVGRAGHLVAEHKGATGTKRMLLIGHLDTVFEPTSPFQTFTRKGDTAEGPGVGDCKGGDVVMIAALRAMKAAGTLDKANIIVVMTGDEERLASPVAVSRKALIDAADRSDVALDFEGMSKAGGKEMGSISRRSSVAWKLATTGRPAHSSGIFKEGVGFGAIYEMARILDGFRETLRQPGLTFNVALVSGGETASLNAGETGGTSTGKKNIVAGQAVALGDIRALTDAQDAQTRAGMEAIVAKHLAGTDATLEFRDGYPAMPDTAGNRAILGALNGINTDMGLPEMGVLDPLGRGAGDISLVASRVDSLAGMGTSGKGAHVPGETIDLASLTLQAKRSALLMSRLSRQPARGAAKAK